MIRHAGRAFALFAVGALFASGAWAQNTLMQTVGDKYTVAEELLGSADGTVVKLSGGAAAAAADTAARPSVRLTVGGATIAEGNEASVSFSLSGAVFGQNVGASTLDLRDSGGAQIAGLATKVTSGGAIGDGSVTFLVEATGTIAATNYLAFWLPDLQVKPVALDEEGTMGVTVTAALAEERAVIGGGNVAFSMVTGTGEMGALMLSERVVLETADVIGISMSMAGKAEVALDNRMAFATSVPGATHTPEGAEAPITALRVGTLTVAIDGGGPPAADSQGVIAGQVFTLDPSDAAVEYKDTTDTMDDELNSSFAGNVDVVVSGAFKAGDMVVYGTPAKAAKIEGGMAAISIPIGAGSTDILYVPGGVDPLRPGAINAVAMLNFSATGNDPGKAVMSAGMINYQGVSVQAYAHGVVRGGGTDSSYVRVRCANATACTVFADCHDQAGMNYFDEAGTIDAGATSVVSSDMIAAALGGGWSSGRGACDLLSNGTLEVQHMVRAGHVLVNNSAVVGRSLSEMRLKSIDDALNDICMSVEGHSGRAQVPENPTADNPITVNAIAKTMCSNHKATAVENTVDTTPDDDSST